jgi:hypothetical protein
MGVDLLGGTEVDGSCGGNKIFSVSMSNSTKGWATCSDCCGLLPYDQRVDGVKRRRAEVGRTKGLIWGSWSHSTTGCQNSSGFDRQGSWARSMWRRFVSLRRRLLPMQLPVWQTLKGGGKEPQKQMRHGSLPGMSAKRGYCVPRSVLWTM